MSTAEPARTRPLYVLAALVGWPVLHLLYRMRVDGLEHIPRDGGFVLAANHVSNFDPWPLGVPLWPGRQLHFMAKSELFNPALGWALRHGGAFPVRRGEQDEEAIATAVAICRRGDVVAMFPEGT